MFLFSEVWCFIQVTHLNIVATGKYGILCRYSCYCSSIKSFVYVVMTSVLVVFIYACELFHFSSNLILHNSTSVFKKIIPNVLLLLCDIKILWAKWFQNRINKYFFFTSDINITYHFNKENYYYWWANFQFFCPRIKETVKYNLMLIVMLSHFSFTNINFRIFTFLCNFVSYAFHQQFQCLQLCMHHKLIYVYIINLPFIPFSHFNYIFHIRFSFHTFCFSSTIFCSRKTKSDLSNVNEH